MHAAEREEPELTWWCLDCAEPGALGENEFDAAIDKARVPSPSELFCDVVEALRLSGFAVSLRGPWTRSSRRAQRLCASAAAPWRPRSIARCDRAAVLCLAMAYAMLMPYATSAFCLVLISLVRKTGGKYLIISNGGLGSEVLATLFRKVESEEIEGYTCDLYYKLVTILLCTK